MVDNENKALVFDIQRYSLHDGPGIRTIIFLKGCPLKCLWCCNPESQADNIEMEFYADKCTRCGRCENACDANAIILGEAKYRIDKNKCTNCGKCADTCINGAIRTVGKWVTVDDATTQLKSDCRYFRKSGGGLTLSGGEPLIWIDFCEEMLKKSYDLDIHTAIETTGCVPTEHIDRIMNYTDLFLYDIKSVDDERHRALTGISNRQILKNIKHIREHDKEVIMRIPLIPGKNFLKEELEMMCHLAHETGIKEINLMPYHNLGEVKYGRLGMNYRISDVKSLKFADDLDSQIAEYGSIFRKYNDVNVIY